MPPRELPPLTPEPTTLLLPGKFVWIDLITQDVEAAQSFYGELFGWTVRDGQRYSEIVDGDRAIGGIVLARNEEAGSEWVGNLSVEDVDRAAELFAARGGKVERGPVDAPNRGRLALVSDREGALLLLVRSTSGDPPDEEPAVGRWLFRVLMSQEPADAAAFYRELAVYDLEIVDLGGLPYHVLRTEELPRAAVVGAPEDVRAHWLPFVRVEDSDVVAAKAAALGARIIMQHDQAAILVDPTGAAFAVQEWMPPSRESEEDAP